MPLRGPTPIAHERLEVTPAGRVLLRFKRAWRSGAHAVVLDPLDFIARLVALLPPPHFNMLRHHGVLAARAKARAEVIPGPCEEPEPAQLRLVFEAKAEPGGEFVAKRRELVKPRSEVRRSPSSNRAPFKRNTSNTRSVNNVPALV